VLCLILILNQVLNDFSTVKFMKNLLTAVERLFSIAGLIETRRNRSSEEMFQKLILLKMNGF